MGQRYHNGIMKHLEVTRKTLHINLGLKPWLFFQGENYIFEYKS